MLNGENHKGVRFVALLLIRISCSLHLSCNLKATESVAWEHGVPFGSLLVTLGGAFPQLLPRATSPLYPLPWIHFWRCNACSVGRGRVLWGLLGTQLCQTRASKYAGWHNATLQTILDVFSSVLKDTNACCSGHWILHWHRYWVTFV